MRRTIQTLQTVCRSCRETTLSSTSKQLQTRHYTASSSRSKSIPVFTQTSNSDFDEILETWREQVFIPAVLSRTHRNLIYKKSRHHLLEKDPGVTVTLNDDEEIKLEPMNEFQRPNKKSSLKAIAKILGEDVEMAVWTNLIGFLEGMQASHQKVPVAFLEKVTRRANEAGRQDVIQKCASMAKTTGLSLSIRPVTRELFWGIHIRAVEAKFRGNRLAGALKEAKSLAAMMDRPEHCGSKTRQPEQGWTVDQIESNIDMRKNPTVAGVLLELYAANALEKEGGSDVDGVVTAYTQRLLALLGDHSTNTFLQREQKPTSGHALADWTPIAQALRLALKVKNLGGGTKEEETKLKMTLMNVLDTLNNAINSEKQKAREGPHKPHQVLYIMEQLEKL